jgi:small subunit ribosomal protein S6
MFYECILIIRPDVSAKHVSEVTRILQGIIEKEGGQVIATEYWGFKTLAYRIEKRAKAHYVCLGISVSSLVPIYKHLEFHRDVLRHLFIRKPRGLTFPTLQMHSSLHDLEHQEMPAEIIDEIENTENTEQSGEA